MPGYIAYYFFLYWFCYEKLRVCILSFLYTHSVFCKFYCSSLYEYKRRFCFLCTVLVLLDSRYLTVINMLDIIHFRKSSLHGLTWYTNWGLKLCEIGECIALMQIFLYGFCDDRYWDMHISTKVYTKEPHSSSYLLFIFLFYNKYFFKFSYRIENQDLLDFWYILYYISAYTFVAFWFFQITCSSSSSSLLNTSIPASGGLGGTSIPPTSGNNGDATSIFFCVPVFFALFSLIVSMMVGKQL